MDYIPEELPPLPANAALLIGIQAAGGLHHVIIRARCLWLQRLRSLLWSFVDTVRDVWRKGSASGGPRPPRGGGAASIGRQRCWGGLGIGGEPAEGHRSV